MKRISIALNILFLSITVASAADPPPVIGLCIEAPRPGEVDRLISFMENELAPGGINTLVLRIDFNYLYESYPNLRGEDPLSREQVNRVRDHLSGRDRELWIWGDRLIDGKTTGMGMWEASENDTHRAIDMIAKDVVICDWHYERADPTAALFALSGFRVITCPWNNPEVTGSQLEMFDAFRSNAPDTIKERYFGFMQTVWNR